jgi:hypothetical protein
MLISMPHGTSTIFGAFQAILALLETGRTLRPPIKLPCDENFASEIFHHETPACFVAMQNDAPREAANRKRIKGFDGSFRAGLVAAGVL